MSSYPHSVNPDETTRDIAADWNGGDALMGRADQIPVGPTTAFMSVSPVRIPAAGRPAGLCCRVSAPVEGKDLPVVVVSHGGGTTHYLSSLRGLSPLVDFWAAHGFVVVQPTHLSSPSLGLPRPAPASTEFWRSRVEDLTRVIDHLDIVESSVPGLAGRLARDRVAVAGHSMGGQSASLLLGAHFTDGGTTVHVPDRRVRAGVLLAPTGTGGDHLTEAGARFTCLRTAAFDRMTTPALVVAGQCDDSPQLTARGASYHQDPYTDAPGPKTLLTLTGAEHQLGGITGYDTTETTDEDPERVGVVQRLTWAYLASALDPASSSWASARAAFEGLDELGTVCSK